MNYSQRYEKKFFIKLSEEKKIKDHFKNIFELEFGQGYFCNSIYFDDLDFSTLRQKQEGTMERFKIRLRTYFFDLNKKPEFWNLEIKAKNNSTVKKRKVKLSHSDVLVNLKNNYSFFQIIFTKQERI